MIKIKSLFIGTLLGIFSSSSFATNYFSWDAESNNYTDNAGSHTFLSYAGNTSRVCTVAHTGSCSMRLIVDNVSGDNQMGAELADWVYLPQNIVGGAAVYYRWWMRINTGFSWGNGTAKTKSARGIGGTQPRFYTGYVQRDGFNLGECDAAGGCVDPGPFISYNMDTKADSQWHEYVVKIKPNTTTSSTDTQFEVWIDGVSVGTAAGKLHDDANNAWIEAWGGWMVYPYFQLNGVPGVDGGTLYIDDISTDNVWNSIFSGGDITPPTGVTITVPSNGAVVIGNQTVTATCTDETGISNVQMLLDGSTLGTADTTSPYSITWNSTTTGNGSHTLSARCSDTSNNQTTSSTISVTVNNPATTECPSNWASLHPTWIWCDDFETDKSASWVDRNGASTFLRNASTGQSSTYSMRATYPSTTGTANAGDFKIAFGSSPVTPKITPSDNTIYREIYWRTYIKTSPNWLSGTGAKFTRATSFIDTNWTQSFIAHWWGGSSDSLLGIDPASGVCRGSLKPNGSACTNNTIITSGYNDITNLYFLGQTSGTTQVFGNTRANIWQCIEGHVKLNTSSLSDGIEELWVDSILEASSTNLNLVGTYSTYGINIFSIENYMNAGTNQVQYRDWDNLIVATTRVGCALYTSSLAAPTNLHRNP